MTTSKGTVFRLNATTWKASVTYRTPEGKRKRRSVNRPSQREATEALKWLRATTGPNGEIREALPHLELMRTRTNHVGGCVYLVEATGIDKVKIGFATNLADRLRNLQTACPVPLKLLAVVAGGDEVELELHRRFAHLRSHGEWFFLTTEVRNAIERLAWQPGCCPLEFPAAT